MYVNACHAIGLRLMKEALERAQLERESASSSLHEMEAKHQALLLE